MGTVLSVLTNLKPQGTTDIAQSLTQIAATLRHASLVMIFSDLLGEPEPILQALHRLRHRGHDVILFHVLDEAETRFPFEGLVEMEEPETHAKLHIDASGFRADYLAELGRVPRDVSPRVFSGPNRLCPVGHVHAIRQSADRIPRPAAGEVLRRDITTETPEEGRGMRGEG